MTDINKLVIIGRVTKDVQDRDYGYTQGGLARLNTSIAVNHAKKNGNQWSEEVSYFDITLWGKTAENLKQYITKGRQLAIEGRLEQQRWTDKNGNNQQRLAIVTESVQLLGGGRGDNQQAPQQQSDGGDNFSEDIPW